MSYTTHANAITHAGRFSSFTTLIHLCIWFGFPIWGWWVATPRAMLFCWNIYMSDAVLLHRPGIGDPKQIWWGPMATISNFSGNFTKNFDFSRQISESFDFFWQFHQNNSILQAKLAVYSCFWANYSISLQKSPLSNMLPVGYMIRYNSQGFFLTVRAGTAYRHLFQVKKKLFVVHSVND